MEKILFFETPEFTGASRVSHTIAKSLSRDHIVIFATISPGKGARKMISEEIDKNKAEELFCSFISLNPDVILEGKRRGLRVTIRQDYKLIDVEDDLIQRAKETYHLADRIIAQTPELRNELIETFCLNPLKVEFKENPIDKEGIKESLKDAQSPYPDDGFIHYVWVGRFVAIKDIPSLLNAFEKIHSENPNTGLYLVGEPDNPEKYIQEAVHLVGFKKDPYPWIKYADYLMLSSKSEACPNVIREAQFLNTQVIIVKNGICYYSSTHFN